MFDLLRKTVAAAVVAAGFSAAAPQVQATTIPFVIDRSASSVTLQRAGAICGFSNCGVTASLADDLDSGDTYNIGTGDTAEFNFLTFDGQGTGAAEYAIEAVLAFSSPVGLAITGLGEAASVTLRGVIRYGELIWTNLPQEITIAGSTFSFDFQSGTCVLFCQNGSGVVTTTASIDGMNVVPLPAGGLLLLSALGGLAILRRRKMMAA